jgi:hypothetical protein
VAVVAVFEAASLTQQHYAESVRRLTGGRLSRMESPADWPVPGLLAHVAGQGKNGFRVVDVWESEEAFSRFGSHIVPILKELGLDIQPDVYSSHALVTA